MLRTSQFARPLLIAATAFLLATDSLPVVAADPVDYAKQIKPILAARCFRCHGASKEEGRLRLDTAAALRVGGENGAAIVAGKSDASLLLKRVRTSDDSERMPPEGDRLSAEQIELLQRWIESGAAAPADEAPQKDPKAHWAFQTPRRPNVPQNEATRAGASPIDQFLSATRTAKGLVALPSTSKGVLLRRVFVDLIGVPPTADELREFSADESSDALEKVVDRLLTDSRYGERWARHWMDVWRYSDWDGYAAEVRESKPHIWRWRDWIVESLNSGKPYDRMLVEMLAADEVASDDPDALRATGFLVRHWFRFNRNVWLDNAVEHTGKAFLGLTFNCAKCHDHMYDPLSQPEYFQLRAFFEPYDVRTDRLPGESDREKHGLVRAFDANANQPTFLFVRGDEAQPVNDKPLPPALPSLFNIPTDIHPVSLPAKAYYPGLQSFIQEEERQKARQQLARAEQDLAAARTKLADAEKQAASAKTTNPTAAPASDALPANAVIADDFKAARPELWNATKGKWEHRDGRLIQTDTETGMGTLISKTPHPANFEATFRFKTTGGKMWKSVGLSFDALDEANYHGVYLSAVASGQKLQISHTSGGQTSYPNDGGLALPIELNRDLELRVVVRDQLANISVNGALCLVYRLPTPRKTGGSLTLWTYDATAEFSRCVVTALPNDKTLRDTAPTTAEQQQVVAAIKSAPVKLDLETLLTEAQQALSQAERLQKAEQSNVRFVEAVITADSAKFGIPPIEDAKQKELAQAASRAEREHAFAQAEVQLGSAEQTLAKARQSAKPSDAKTQKAVTDAEANLTKKQQARDSTAKAIETVGDQYKGLSENYPTTSTGRRSTLARWIASRDNPLTARVAVNHIWMRHFGTPLVASVFDFGINGKAPTHPELLDWLAVEFMDSGWDQRHLHRLIVLSEAYRLTSSTPETSDQTKQNFAIDPENLTLWRFNPRRLEAEAVRDATLHVAGSLEHQPGGPDLDPNLGLTSGRRSLYFRSSKEKRMTFTSLFDGPNVSECYRRSESIAPQQALAMANSGLTLAQSRILAGKLAERVLIDSKNSDRAWLNSSPGRRAFVSLAFEQLLNRPPTDAELGECETFLGEQTQSHAEPGKQIRFKTSTTSGVPPSADATQRARENLIHVLLNHHEFVTVR